MSAEALILRPIRHGWSVQLSGGRELATFHGPGSWIRAERYIRRLRGTTRPRVGVSSKLSLWRDGR